MNFFSFFVGLKGKLIAFGALCFAILTGLAYERHKGKVEGEQIAAGKAAGAVAKAQEQANVAQSEVSQKPDGQAAKDLEDKWTR